MPKPNQPPRLDVLASPACKHLRSKGMYVSGLTNPADDIDGGMEDGYCWCNQTAAQMGPDNEVVDRPECSDPTRPCYEPPL